MSGLDSPDFASETTTPSIEDMLCRREEETGISGLTGLPIERKTSTPTTVDLGKNSLSLQRDGGVPRTRRIARGRLGETLGK